MEAALIVGILQLIIREAPGAIQGIRDLVNKDDITDADYEAAKAKIIADSFGKLAPDADNFRTPSTPVPAPTTASAPAPTAALKPGEASVKRTGA